MQVVPCNIAEILTYFEVPSEQNKAKVNMNLQKINE